VAEVGCLENARRKSFDLDAAHKNQIAGFALKQLAMVYDIKREVKELKLICSRAFGNSTAHLCSMHCTSE